MVHTQKKPGNVKDVVPDNTPAEVVEHRLSGEGACLQCGEPMREIGAEARETLKLIPTKAVLQRDIFYTYVCENCEKNDISTPVLNMPKAAFAVRLLHLIKAASTAHGNLFTAGHIPLRQSQLLIVNGR